MAFTFGMNVNPDADLTRSLGSSAAKWKMNGHVVELIETVIDETDETTVTISNAHITADHVVLNPYVLDTEITYTTSAGAVTFQCADGFPDTVFYLGIKV